jgi:hypothetical protein
MESPSNPVRRVGHTARGITASPVMRGDVTDYSTNPRRREYPGFHGAINYFEPLPPRLARNTIIESTFEVGRRPRCTVRITVASSTRA